MTSLSTLESFRTQLQSGCFQQALETVLNTQVLLDEESCTNLNRLVSNRSLSGNEAFEKIMLGLVVPKNSQDKAPSENAKILLSQTFPESFYLQIAIVLAYRMGRCPDASLKSEYILSLFPDTLHKKGNGFGHLENILNDLVYNHFGLAQEEMSISTLIPSDGIGFLDSLSKTIMAIVNDPSYDYTNLPFDQMEQGIGYINQFQKRLDRLRKKLAAANSVDGRLESISHQVAIIEEQFLNSVAKQSTTVGDAASILMFNDRKHIAELDLNHDGYVMLAFLMGMTLRKLNFKRTAKFKDEMKDFKPTLDRFLSKSSAFYRGTQSMLDTKDALSSQDNAEHKIILGFFSALNILHYKILVYLADYDELNESITPVVQIVQALHKTIFSLNRRLGVITTPEELNPDKLIPKGYVCGNKSPNSVLRKTKWLV